MNLDPFEVASAPADGITRREILAWSSAAAVGSLATSTLASAALPVGPTVQVEPMSVGFIVGSDQIDGFPHVSWEYAGRSLDGQIEVVPAASADADNGSFVTAHVRVAGVYPNPAALGNLALAMTVLMPTDRGSVPFYPWSVRRGSVREVSPPTAFDVPLNAQGGGLELLLEVAAPSGGKKVASGKASSSTRLYGTRFTSTNEKGVPRLRRGLYLLATQWGMWEQALLLPPADQPQRADRVSVVIAVDPMISPFER